MRKFNSSLIIFAFGTEPIIEIQSQEKLRQRSTRLTRQHLQKRIDLSAEQFLEVAEHLLVLFAHRVVADVSEGGEVVDELKDLVENGEDGIF